VNIARIRFTNCSYDFNCRALIVAGTSISFKKLSFLFMQNLISGQDSRIFHYDCRLRLIDISPLKRLCSPGPGGIRLLWSIVKETMAAQSFIAVASFGSMRRNLAGARGWQPEKFNLFIIKSRISLVSINLHREGIAQLFVDLCPSCSMNASIFVFVCSSLKQRRSLRSRL